MKNRFKNRYSPVLFLITLFVILSALIRFVLAIWVASDLDWKFTSIVTTFLFGFLYDISVISCFSLVFVFYLLCMPNKWRNSWLDRSVVYVLFFLFVLLFYFSFFAEITFWDEFKSRFNFIAVDYLIYTYEVVKNIQESYPLPILLGGMFLVTAFTFLWARHQKIFYHAFHSPMGKIQRLTIFLLNLMMVVLSLYFLDNDSSSFQTNRYNNEISKAGIFSFFSAFRNNHLKYDEHYQSIPIEEAFSLVKKELQDSKTIFDTLYKNPLRRTILPNNPHENEQKPHVIFVMMESMSASFLTETNNQQLIAPNLHKLANESIYFSNMYANGTRTVRGMEAVTLSIPPTPGNSIVKRVENQNLYTISSVFRAKGYHNMFFYGGDGYFDNMNAFFGGNGFDIYDRGRGSVLSDKINTHRYTIADKDVTFENAWGISDEDIYNKVLQVADEKSQKEQPFFAFVMTTSNHKPYTYLEGKIDIPSGSGRQGAVKYSDYAIGEFLKKAQKRPWFKKTVFVFIADHCASSAGKDAIDIKNHHIPALIYNLQTHDNMKVTKEVSQIDIFPTLFSLLNWTYVSQFYGKDIFDPEYQSRSFVGTYIKLGMKKDQEVVVLSDQKKANQYLWENNALHEVAKQQPALKSTIANYQTADYLYMNHLLNEK